MIYAVLFALGGFFYRLRGSDAAWLTMLTKRTYGLFEGRFFWAALCTSVVMAATGNIWYMLLLPLFFLGVVFGYFGGEFNLENPANRNVKNYATLAARGAVIVLPVFILSGQAWGGVIAGAFLPIYYLLGLPLQKLNLPIPYLSRFSEWGEFLLGGAVLVSIYATVGSSWLG